MPKYRVDTNGAVYIGYSLEVEADSEVEAQVKVEEYLRQSLAFVRVHKPGGANPACPPDLYDCVIEDNIEINATGCQLLEDTESQCPS